jgi:hypothetical protein
MIRIWILFRRFIARRRCPDDARRSRTAIARWLAHLCAPQVPVDASNVFSKRRKS